MNKILIVDDQLYIRVLVSKELAKEGYRTSDLGCIERIRERINNYCPDLVLLGLHLENCDCWEIFENAKKEFPNLPILIYVVKRFRDIDSLKQAVNEVLGNKDFLSDKQFSVYGSF